MLTLHDDLVNHRAVSTGLDSVTHDAQTRRY